MNWTERLINRVAKAALANLVDAETSEVDIQTSLKQLQQGIIDAIAVQFSRVCLRDHLCLQSLHLTLNEVAVKPLSALRGNIQLLRPAAGSLSLTLADQALSHFLQNTLSPYWIASSQRQEPAEGFSADQPERQDAIRMEWIRCRILPETTIAFDFAWTINNLPHLRACTVVTQASLTQSQPDGLADTLLDRLPDTLPDGLSEGLPSPMIHLNVQSIEHEQPPTELINAILSPIDSILNLSDLRDRGLRCRIEQIQTTPSLLSLQAQLWLDYFPH